MNLEIKDIKTAVCIFGNTTYGSEVQRAEDIVNLFDKIPKRCHVDLAKLILNFCRSTVFPKNTKSIGMEYRVSEEDVVSARNSAYIKEFLLSVYGVMAKDSMEDMARVISFYMHNASTLAHRVAIFVDIFTDVRLCIIIQGDKLK